MEELRESRKRGFSLDREEHEDDTYCIDSPIFNEKGEVFAACSISGRDREIVGSKLEDFSAGIRYTAQEISRRMGSVTRAETLLWKEMSNPLCEK